MTGTGKTRELEIVTTGTKKYRKLTEEILKAREKNEQRAAAGMWSGWTLDRPVMRLGGAAAVRAASVCAAAHGARAKLCLKYTQRKHRRREGPGQAKAAKGRKVPRRPASAAPRREEARPSGVGGDSVALGSAIRPAPRSGTVKVLPSLRTRKSEAILSVKSRLRDSSSEDDLRIKVGRCSRLR